MLEVLLALGQKIPADIKIAVAHFNDHAKQCERCGEHGPLGTPEEDPDFAQ